MPISSIPTTVLSGRTLIRTDLETITIEGLKKDLRRVLPLHEYNAEQIMRLQEYMKGWHPVIQARVKTTRTDVDNKVTVNYARAMTREIVGYFLGKPIQYTHAKGASRKAMEAFVRALDAENKGLVDYEIAEDCSIAGVGYRGMFSETDPRNGTHLSLLRLDPLTTFVVYPSDPTKPPLYAVTYYQTQGEMTDAGVVTYYTVYTASQVYKFKSQGGLFGSPLGELELVGKPKPFSFGGHLPIVEYQNNMWRLGDWETEIAIMDALDAVTSDGVNDIQQAVNSVLVAMGMELTDDMFANLSAQGFLNVANIPPGVNPVVEFINQAMNADVGVAMREYLEATLRILVGVPDRKTRGGGGGDTGDAVFMRDGWQDIDLVASSKEPHFIKAEREALAVMLYILDTHREISNLIAQDIEIHFNRNKTSNLQSKAQSYQTLTSGSAPINPADALDMVGLTNNVADVILRSESWAKKHAEQSMALAQAGKSDESDPNGDGTSSAGDDEATE